MEDYYKLKLDVDDCQYIEPQGIIAPKPFVEMEDYNNNSNSSLENHFELNENEYMLDDDNMETEKNSYLKIIDQFNEENKIEIDYSPFDSKELYISSPTKKFSIFSDNNSPSVNKFNNNSNNKNKKTETESIFKISKILFDSEGRNWNEQFQQLLENPTTTPEQMKERYSFWIFFSKKKKN